MATSEPIRVSIGAVTDRWRVTVDRFQLLATEVRWVRDVPVGAASRWEFVLALASMLVVGTGALIGTLMGASTAASPGLVRMTYVGVIVLAVVTCATLLLVESGVARLGPLAGMVGEVDRDAVYAVSLGLASSMLVMARMSPGVGGLLAVGAGACIAGQVAYVAGARDLRRMANVAVVAAVVGYVWYLLAGASSACPGCTRGAWVIALAGLGAVLGATIGWVVCRMATAAEMRAAVSVGTVAFVMASVFFLVRDPVRATFGVIALLALSLVSTVPVHVLDRSRDLVIDVGCLALGVLELVVGPSGTVPVGVVVLLVRAATRVRLGWFRAVVAVAGGVIGIALSVNVVPPWDEPHHAFFLFPMRDVAAGKSLLVDVNAQYGVGLIYALTLLVGDSVATLTPTGLSAWTNVANVALYVALWVGCAWVVRDWAIGSVMWLAVVVNRSVSIGFAEAYPSTGAWRFGLPWLLVADAAASRGRMGPWRRVLRTTYWIVASTWSLEVLLYSAVMLAGDLVIDALRGWRDGDGIAFSRQAAERVAEAIGGATISTLLLVGVTTWRAGQWPDARHYLEYFGTYGAGLGFEQPVLWSAWSPMFLSCAAVMVVLGFRAGFSASQPADVGREKGLALVGAYGVLQFTYYAFRPHSNNLLHVMFPSAVVAIWLLARTAPWIRVGDADTVPRDARAVVGAAMLAGVAVVGASGLTALVPRVPTTLVGQAIRLWSEGRMISGPWFGTVPSALSGDRQALRDLLARRYPAAARVPMLLSDDLWIHAVIGTPYVNAFPLSFAPQDSLVPIGANSALAAVRALPFGTELVMEADVERLEGLRRAMAGTLCERGSLILEEAVERVVVVRNAEGRGGGDVCRRWGMVAVP